LKIRLALEKGIDPFDDALDVSFAADAANPNLSHFLRQVR
jgi:hypothetical protein